MLNIWRQQPSYELTSSSLIEHEQSDNQYFVADDFFEEESDLGIVSGIDF